MFDWDFENDSEAITNWVSLLVAARSELFIFGTLQGPQAELFHFSSLRLGEVPRLNTVIISENKYWELVNYQPWLVFSHYWTTSVVSVLLPPAWYNPEKFIFKLKIIREDVSHGGITWILTLAHVHMSKSVLSLLLLAWATKDDARWQQPPLIGDRVVYS